MLDFLWNIPAEYGDVLAIPFFIMLIYYFAGIENKTFSEYILYGFVIFALLFDILQTTKVLSDRVRKK